VNPVHVRSVAGLLKNSSVKACTVIGFPLGAASSETKLFEAKECLAAGASELDMVVQIGALKEEKDDLVRSEISALAELCHGQGALLKVILETSLLTDEEKKRACRLCVEANADFVKTSTGFSSGGATAADVRLMADAVRGSGLGVKASGGICTLADMTAMLDAGATRIGTSSGVAIIREALASG
jgi:deoxyribose-phosphate aldolase